MRVTSHSQGRHPHSHLPHHAGLDLEEVVLGVFEEAVFAVVAPGGGAVGDGHVLARFVGDVGFDGVLPGADAGDRLLVAKSAFVKLIFILKTRRRGSSAG